VRWTGEDQRRAWTEFAVVALAALFSATAALQRLGITNGVLVVVLILSAGWCYPVRPRLTRAKRTAQTCEEALVEVREMNDASAADQRLIWRSVEDLVVREENRK
jgi:hypothetical protein